MAAEIIQIDTQDFTSQNYGNQDTNLISSFDVNTNLSSSSYIEYFIYDNNQNLLSEDYNFTEYTVINDGQSAGNNGDISQIIIDPEASLISYGFDQGEYITYYNFFNKQIGSELQQLYISEISSDRTEIRLDSTSLTDADIVEQANSLIQQRNDSPYFLDFYLNFGENQLSIANNIQLDNQDPTNPTILIKLYEALPSQFDINSTLWVVTLVEEPIAYKVTFEDEVFTIADTTSLKGPNFNLDLKDQVNNSTISYDYTSLTTTSLTSSQDQLKSLLEEKEIDINIDYTDFNNFIHFSSVQTRLENFYYKVSLIEQYSSSIATLDNATNSPSNISSSKAVYESKISDIITNFDGYDYYLYYTSGSWAWPKTTNEPPYLLATTGSTPVLTWFGSSDEGNPYYGGISLSASNFDNLNQNNLYYSIPEYLRDDPSNDQYSIFVEMVGQFYDNIWIYYKDITEKYNADNRLENGVSKDIVADAIRDFGIKLYQNNFSNEDLYTAFLGLTPEGALFPFPNITDSLPTPSGFEYVDTLISASNDYMPLDDVNKSLYKRIYHNLPYLLKAKGTLPALRTLITSYGIPDTVLRINEYGGKDKVNSNDWDYWQNEFNYAYHNTGSNVLSTNWVLNSSWNSSNNVPSTLEFRFKVPDLSIVSGSTGVNLWSTNTNSRIRLRYTGSGLATGSYSGSIIDPYYQYTHLDFFPDFTSNPTLSASIYLPFSNEQWWSVMATRNGNNFKLHAGNNVYEGGDNNTELGFYATSSITVSSTPWTSGVTSQFMPQGTEMYLQEIRYYNTILNESIFKDYIMNPSSIEGNSLNSSPNELAFRLSLGGELYTGSLSIHPKITGSWSTTSSFVTNSSGSFLSTPVFEPNEEYFFYDQPVAGIKNAISDKIRLENDTLPSGNTLSAIRALSQQPNVSSSYTANTNLLEVAFSPQDEINEDIMDQIGYFNIGEYIGDPRLRSSSAESYPALDNLRNAYFEKYTSNYDLVDYIRLIKFFDNSLFKMIKDFVPARTSLASGVIIKQHLLERNKYPQPQTDINSTIAYGSSGSINNIPLIYQDISVSGTVAPQWNDYNEGTIENFSGGTGGTMDIFNGLSTSPVGTNGTGPDNIFDITQSWSETVPSPLGFVTTLHDNQDEFYDGEFSGSMITVTTQSLNTPYPLTNQSFNYTPVIYSNVSYNLNNFNQPFAQNQFLNSVTTPSQGQILILIPYQTGKTSSAISPSFIKIHKLDNNGTDNSLPLGQITNLLIQYTSDIWDNISIVNISEFPTYYLYQALPSNPTDNLILDYNFSGSISTTQLLSAGSGQTLKYTSSIDIQNIYNQTTGQFTYNNTPNIPIIFTASFRAFTDSSTALLNLDFTGTNVTSTNITATTTPTTFTYTGSIYPLQSIPLDLFLYNITGTPAILSNFQIVFTQSIAPSAPEYDSVIFEPYVTTPNYYNSDDNPLINNVLVDRLSTIYEDIDYSTGITTPTNFDLLISGSALKAAVQDSNYSSKRVINPRYDGCKSTSQHLNYWTPGDTGTYGKLSSIDSLKNAVAYCDGISGWTPERMNASALMIKYLIKSDGTVVIPNTTPSSLADNKGTFETGENVEIQFKNAGGQITPMRKVIRGGTRIEPILYTQYGGAPNISWNTTMSFTDVLPPATSASADYSSQFVLASTNYINADGALYTPTISSATHGASYLNSNGYQVPLGVVQDAISLTFNGSVNISLTQPFIGPNISYNVNLSIWRGTTQLYFQNYPNQTTGGNYSVTYTQNINFTAGDIYVFKITVEGDASFFNYQGEFQITGGVFSINQSPIFQPPLPITTGVNSIWQYYNTSTHPNIITSSVPELTQFYDDPNVKMVDLPGSGFNPIQFPWSIKYGDEFRFEGREDFVYQVGKIFGPSDSGSGRLTQTGSIEVHFNYDLPVSASSSAFNLDHFLIRRYVDDATTAIIEGFKPTNSVGPYIIKPEFVVPELDKDIDSFILDLTQKGLI
jgi:hypothetical protein